jgi:chondroitin 4-sulfotransferase 11
MNRILTKPIRLIQSIKHRYLDDFIFIHINKTGGSSIENALKIPLEHKTATEKQQQLGEKEWNKKLTFTVVRNPWDKVVSHYHYRVKTNQTNLRNKPIKFKEWVKLTYKNMDETYYDKPKMFMPQTSWITDSNGKIIVDEILNFENLNEDFNSVMVKLGKQIPLPHLKRSNHINYKTYYDTETVEIVDNWFKEDINNFDYQF